MGTLRLLLDTHTLYWWHLGDPALSATAQAAIADSRNEKYVSAITAWEFIAKFRSGRQPEFAAIASDVAAVVASHGFIQIPIAMRHAQAASDLPFHHKDPMVRFLIGQAIVEDMTIVTIDGAFASYTARLLW
ncbi:MAG: type II toxin-antitoxin system VapC family toxin [Rhodopila sp.]|jgi:PIN domain nuclease of toxin-antitoxin system